MPISFNNAKCTLGVYYSSNGGSFKFSNHYFQDPEWPIESALDVIRHEYAHHMDHVLYGHGGHGPTWKLCCNVIGASPIRCYSKERADYYRNKHLEETKLSNKYDTYKIGDKITHPKFGTGVILEVYGESINRCMTIEFQGFGVKKLGISWVYNNCEKCMVKK